MDGNNGTGQQSGMPETKDVRIEKGEEEHPWPLFLSY